MKKAPDYGNNSKRFLKALSAFTKEAEAYAREYEQLRESSLDLIDRLAEYERAARGSSKN